MPPQWNHVYAVFFPHAPVLNRVYSPMERWTSQESGSAIGDAFLERISEVASTGLSPLARAAHPLLLVEHRKRLPDALPIGRGNHWFPTERTRRLRVGD